MPFVGDWNSVSIGGVQKWWNGERGRGVVGRPNERRASLERRDPPHCQALGAGR
jgi:hypothetical protein